MGHVEHTTVAGTSTRGRRLGWRTCLRKGCGRRYQAQHWRQRYCRKPDCLRELRRWQAAKRQRKRRATAEGRERHARGGAGATSAKEEPATSPSLSVRDGARGHAIKKFLPGRFAIGPAVLNLLKLLFEPPHATAATSAARPCAACEIANASGSPARQRLAGWKRRLEYEEARAKRRQRATTGSGDREGSRPAASSDGGQRAVGVYRDAAKKTLTSPYPQDHEAPNHDPKASAPSRPRAPPAS